MAMKVNEIAACIHKDMVDDDSNGYSWDPRWGEDGKGVKTITACGVKVSYDRGSYDCASSVVTAWKAALKGTKYEHALDGATWTGNIAQVFVDSGLFVKKPISFIASPGDLYLRHDADGDGHVAMCQSQEPDLMSEFCINEHGGVYGGQVGDQTGREAAVNPFRDEFYWVIHYNGKADDVAPKPAPTPSTKTRLNGIDIASWQEGIDLAKVQADFVIIKVSGGTSYINPLWKQWADAALKAGKLLGFYHYADEYGAASSGKAEAEFFLKQIKGFEGKAIMCLDWEADATGLSVSYAKAWLDAVAKATGSTPLFYSYASYLNSTDLSSIAKYPLWVASYPYKYENGSGYVDDPDMISGTGDWKAATIYQYSSTRKISGYASRLDCNVFYGTREDWAKLAGGSAPTPEPTPEPTPSKDPVVYRTSNDRTGKKWNQEYRDIERDGHSGLAGKPIRWLAMDGVKRYRVCTEESGWLPWVKRYDVKDLEDGCAGDGSPINGIQVDDATCHYAVHVMRGPGEWYPDMHGLIDSGGTNDNFAGDLANRIDLFRAKRA